MKSFTHLFLLCSIIFAFLSCKGRQSDDVIKGNDSISAVPIKYNIYIENSGSMAGYCNYSNGNALETLIKDYYDRLNSITENEDTITINFINTSIVRVNENISAFLSSIKGKCNERYTKLDDMLDVMMDSVNDNEVNIMISDFVFTTDNGNFLTASSSITSLFQEQLKNKEIAVGITKYMRDFNGLYYPGGLRCNKPMPIYVWVFGKPDAVRKVVKMPIKTQNCGEYFLQKANNIPIKLNAESKRMVKDNSLIVEDWKPVRHEDYYEFSAIADLSKTLLTNTDIEDISRYMIKSDKASSYQIAQVAAKENDKYEYKIRTRKPAPGRLKVYYPILTPEWIEKSNYTGSGIPTDSTTLGISYLIDGVSNAFRDCSHNSFNYFEFEVELK